MKKKALTSALISASMLVSSFGGLCVFAADSAPFSYSDGKVTVSKIDGYDSAAIIVAKYADGGALSEVKITNAASFPVTVDAAVGDKVMVWNNVDGETGMKPIADAFTVVQPVETEQPTENVTKAPETEKPTEVVTTAPETEKPTETVTADPTIEYTVSIGTVTGAEGANIYIVNPAAPTDAPTPAPTAAVTPEITATPPATQAPTLPPTAENATKFTVDASTSVAAGSVYSDDESITVKTEFAGKLGSTAATIGGVDYTNSIQIRIDGTDPDKGEYTVRADCTPLLITAKKDGKFTIYYRRQADSSAAGVFTPANGKDIRLSHKNGDSYEAATAGEYIMTSATEDGKYAYGTQSWKLSAGETYLLWARGTTGTLYGYTYEPSETAVAIAEEGAAAEKYLTTMKAHAGDTITIKADEVQGKAVKVSTAPETTVTDNDNGTYTFTMPAADTVVNAEYGTALPADQAWLSTDEELMAAATAAGDKAAFGPVNGLSGYGNWVKHSSSAEYTHTNGVTYSFTNAFQAGSGNATRRSFQFTPAGSCIVTVAYAAQEGRPVYICQGDTILASGEEGKTGNAAATISADIEDPSQGDVIIYGGSSNKDIFGIFADYYDPNVLVLHKLSGTIAYAGAETGINVVFTDTKDGTVYSVPAVNGAYEVELRQNRSYNISVQDENGISAKVAPTLDTNEISMAKLDKTHNINLVDIAPMQVTGDIVVHDINNDGTTLDLSKVQLTFTAKDDAQYTYTTGISDNKINVTMMPNHEYSVTATGNDGYALSELSGSYVMAAGDMAPFKNLLFTEVLGAIPFSDTVAVGADKAYATINDAMAAIKKMTDRPAGEAGRVTVLIDPGVYTEQVIVDSNYVTLKAADEANRPEIQWYYGIGYLYYSSAGNQYYSEDCAVQKTEKGPVTRWGAACRITGQYCNLESIIIRHTFNCDVTEAELADGVEAATHNEYSDTNGKPDRTAAGYDARSQAATERAAAIALDGGYTELYKCDFISSQDTFYTNKTAYAKECYIEGGTDFIYGGNSMLFENCTLAWHGYSDGAKGGYLTACKTSGPSTGTPSEATNGYMFKNTKIVNSKYYPDNQFAAGSWGRNWGGADCQVVFDGVVLEGVDIPGAWTKMGGELSTSILYVNNVMDKDGGAVDVSGTNFNPNGTMETNGYTMMKDTDYFGGTWVPPHYDKVIELTEYTSIWYFGKSNGAPEYNMQGAGAETDITASSSNNPVAQSIHVDAANGKFSNANRDDEWCQWTAGTVLTVPVVNGSIIQLSTYLSGGSVTINGEAVSGDMAYTYYGTANTVDIVSTNGGYIASVKVISPVNPSTDIPTPPPATAVKGSISGLDAADANAVKLIVKQNNLLSVLDVADGTFETSVRQGQEPEVMGIYGGASAYTIPAGTKLAFGEETPVITAEKVVPELKYSGTTYNLGNGSVVPAISVDYANFVTQDGLVTFQNMKYHNDHGITNANGTLTINVQVPAGDTTISFNGCAYAGDTTVITAPNGVSPVSANLKTASDNTPIDFTYSGDATDLTFTISGGAIYLHALTVKTSNADAKAEDAIFNFTPANNGYIEATEAATSDYSFQNGAVVITKGARYHNDHGLSMPAGDVITIKAGGPMDISIGSCQYSNADVTLKDAEGNVLGTASVGGNALAGQCYKNDPAAKATLQYRGGAAELVINLSGSIYFPALEIKNVTE